MEGFLPQGKICHLLARKVYPLGKLLFIFLVKSGDNLTDDFTCLIADIAFLVQQKLHEKSEGHQLLLFRHICGILS